MSSKPSSLDRILSLDLLLLSFKLIILRRITKNFLANTSIEKFNVFFTIELEYLNIVEISIISFFISTKNENNKLFSLTLNKIAL